MPDYKLDDDNQLRDYRGQEYGKVDSSNVVWGRDSRAGYIDNKGSYIGEDGRYLGSVDRPFVDPTPGPRYVESYSGSSSTSKLEDALSVAIIAIVLSILFIGIIIVLTPITAPIYLSNAERARKRQDTNEVRNWTQKSKLASAGAILVVLGIATIIGTNAFSIFFGSVLQALKISPSEFSAWFVRVPAIIVASTAFILTLVTGMAPTAMVYLRQKELQLREVGRTAKAITMRQYNWLIGVIAVGTLAMIGTGIVIVVLVQRFLLKS